ncbi:hypothetical protein RHSIM_Rhsim09G0046800 [Rhododendron simsii]|uniref:Dirigent protein n=1 Tax=Rhododendron simsii TaxID=118357 RepID=A0A834GGF8_RHOSS|nr:hypothetical protein RHSIM_Rhsim09G0046800 [Rhododendron simsii]
MPLYFQQNKIIIFTIPNAIYSQLRFTLLGPTEALTRARISDQFPLTTVGLIPTSSRQAANRNLLAPAAAGSSTHGLPALPASSAAALISGSHSAVSVPTLTQRAAARGVKSGISQSEWIMAGDAPAERRVLAMRSMETKLVMHWMREAEDREEHEIPEFEMPSSMFTDDTWTNIVDPSPQMPKKSHVGWDGHCELFKGQEKYCQLRRRGHYIVNHGVPLGTGLAGTTFAGNSNNNGRLFATQLGPDGLGLGFGTITVIDDIMTSSPELGLQSLRKAQGIYVASSADGSIQMMAFTVMMEGGEYGDSLNFFGVYKIGSVMSKLSLTSGTGKYKNACGFAEVRSLIPAGQHVTNGVETLLRIIVHLKY